MSKGRLSGSIVCDGTIGSRKAGLAADGGGACYENDMFVGKSQSGWKRQGNGRKPRKETREVR